MSKPFTVNRTCILCSEEVTITTTEEGMTQWYNGEFIQDAMPELTPDEREIMISGICGLCFDKEFTDE